MQTTLVQHRKNITRLWTLVQLVKLDHSGSYTLSLLKDRRLMHRLMKGKTPTEVAQYFLHILHAMLQNLNAASTDMPARTRITTALRRFLNIGWRNKRHPLGINFEHRLSVPVRDFLASSQAKSVVVAKDPNEAAIAQLLEGISVPPTGNTTTDLRNKLGWEKSADYDPLTGAKVEEEGEEHKFSAGSDSVKQGTGQQETPHNPVPLRTAPVCR